MTRAEKYLGFNDTWLIIMGIPIITCIVSIILFGPIGIQDYASFCFPMGFVYTTIFWFGFRFICINYHRAYPDYNFSAQRLFYVVSRMAIMYIVVDLALEFTIDQVFEKPPALHEALGIKADVVAITMIALGFFVYEGIYYFNKSRTIEIEKNKLERISAEQRLNTLKNQVNPHFLFNSLNTLITMIPEEPDTAINFVQKLSKTYRNILEVRDEKLISLKQELFALESYIYLLKTRFQGKIHIFNSIEKSKMEHFIIPISLQILIENAVKHNITSSNKPLKIEIYSEDEFVVVRNNLQKKNQKYNSTKMGLANIKSRYKLLTNKDIVVSETEDFYTVKLPLIQNKLDENTDY